MTQPAFKITLGGADLTSKIKPRFMSLTLTECRGGEADQLDLTLDDSDGKLAIPPKGEKIELMLGWLGKALVNKGSFIVDEVEHSGTPDKITLRARTADLIDDFRQLEDRSFHDTTVGAIIDAIAFSHDLKSGCAASLRSKKIQHVDQTRESDANFLRRLGKQYDAVGTVKNDVLIFAPANHSKTVSGKDLPTIKITRKSGDHHRYHSAERDSYSGVRAYWHDQKRATRRSVLAGISGNAKRLRTTFATEADALQAARAEWQRIQRGIYTFELALAVGIPEAMPQSPVQVSGFKPDIDATDWLAVKLTHNVTPGNGLTSHIELETKTEEADTSPAEPAQDPDKGVTGVTAEWKDKVSKKTGTEFAGMKGNTKKLSKVYATKFTARRAAKLEWAKITERRELIAEREAD